MTVGFLANIFSSWNKEVVESLFKLSPIIEQRCLFLVTLQHQSKLLWVAVGYRLLVDEVRHAAEADSRLLTSEGSRVDDYTFTLASK